MHTPQHIDDLIARVTAGVDRRALAHAAAFAADHDRGCDEFRDLLDGDYPPEIAGEYDEPVGFTDAGFDAILGSMTAVDDPAHIDEIASEAMDHAHDHDDDDTDQEAAKDNATFVKDARKALQKSRAAQIRLLLLRRADAAPPITTIPIPKGELTSARIDALDDALTATTRTALGVVHHALTARVQRAGRIAATASAAVAPGRACRLK